MAESLDPDGTIAWLEGRIEEIDADRPIAELIDLAQRLDFSDWLVVRRWMHFPENPEWDYGHFYVLRPDEVTLFTFNRPDVVDGDRSIAETLELREDLESPSNANHVVPVFRPAQIDQPSQLRVVDIARQDHGASVVRVGEMLNVDFTNTVFSPNFRAFVERPLSADGPPEEEGFGAGPEDDAVSMIDVVFSAAAPEKLQVNRSARIDVRIELEEEAEPLDFVDSGSVAEEKEIVVALRSSGSSIEVIGDATQRVAPPESGVPRELAFTIKAVTTGVTDFEIAFVQESAEVGSVGFSIKVLKRSAPRAPATVTGRARHVETIDDRTLSIAVIEPSALEPNRYRYQVTSRALGWTAREFVSPAFTQGLSEFQRDVMRDYRSLEDAFAPTATDLQDSLDRLEGVGARLAKALIPEDLAGELWEHRDQIGPIHLRSFEPYIPWELIKLWNPKSARQSLDDRFLGEYDLVRHFSGTSAPISFRAVNWYYAIGDYQSQPGYDPVGEERSFFSEELAGKLASAPELVTSNKTRIKALLKQGTADVIHLACHGEAELDDIGSASLIIGVRPRVGGFDPLKLTSDDVQSSLRLRERRPVVFLNACQTGRLGVRTGNSSGWPKVLWDAGAGAVVGTLWKVRSRAARLFAVAFYQALMDGDSLGVATGKARQSARANGDVSWMAYVVYGDPAARFE